MEKPTRNTAQNILDVAQELIQTRGYNACSFNNIADRVGIKKPSIMHHFSNKAALGRAVIIRYRETFAAALDSIASTPNKTAMDAFEFYCTPYTDFGATKDKVCLCGALAGEYMGLPENVQAEVTRFFEDHLIWLEAILKRGKENGEFKFRENAHFIAQLILDSLQGSLIIKRATGDGERIHQTISVLKAKLVLG